MESLLGPDTTTYQGQPTVLFQVSSNSQWSAVMDVRKLVQKQLEDAKDQGIENSLDAGYASSSFEINAFSDDLADIFGVSRIEFSNNSDISIRDLRNEPCCERSWKRDDTVSLRPDGSYLSERDYHAIQ